MNAASKEILRPLQDAIYRDKVCRARAMTATERLDEGLELSNDIYTWMLVGEIVGATRNFVTERQRDALLLDDICALLTHRRYERHRKSIGLFPKLDASTLGISCNQPDESLE